MNRNLSISGWIYRIVSSWSLRLLFDRITTLSLLADYSSIICNLLLTIFHPISFIFLFFAYLQWFHKQKCAFTTINKSILFFFPHLIFIFILIAFLFCLETKIRKIFTHWYNLDLFIPKFWNSIIYLYCEVTQSNLLLLLLQTF